MLSQWQAPVEIVHRIIHQRAEEKGEELVVLTQVLAHDLTVGYEELENMLLLNVNGVAVKNLRQVRSLVERCQGEDFLRFTLHNNLVLVLRAEDARKATPEALEKHGIPSATSPDLDDVPAEPEAA
eukprot:Skav210314  [mRNA]  locus=scaffold475:260904:261401:- [translate_table: standard]